MELTDMHDGVGSELSNGRLLNSEIKLHLSGLIGTATHPDNQKIRIIGFFLKKIGYIDSLKRKKILKTADLGYIFI